MVAPRLINTTDIGVTAAGFYGARGGRLMHLSDSFGAQQTGYTDAGVNPYKALAGIAVALEVFSRGQFTFDPTNNKGVNGETTAQMLARFDADVLANAANFDILLIDGARNDPSTSKAQGDATIANLWAIVQRTVAMGKDPWVILPNPPRSYAPNTATDQKVRAYVNVEMQRLCSVARIPFINPWRDLVDPSDNNGAWASGISTDGLHTINGKGPRLYAKRALDTVGALYPKGPRVQSAWDQYDATYSPFGNALTLVGGLVPRFGGTGGTLSGGVTGALAAGWYCDCNSGTGSDVVASKVAAVAGYDSTGGDRQRFVIGTPLATAWSGELYTGFTIPAGLAGKQAVLEVEVELTGWNTVLPGFAAYLRGGSAIGQMLNVTHIDNGERALLRTAPVTLGSAGAFCITAFGLYPGVGAAGTVDFMNPIMRPLT